MQRLDVGGYLTRLGLPDPGRPSVAALFDLHRAHVERVPYENLEIHLGSPTTVDPVESAERIVRRRRGGYCFHLNGAFAALLSALGYRVRWHVGGVRNSLAEPIATASGNHLALTVHGLVTPDCPDGVWFVDVGLGDALHEPLPLRPGTFRQGPFGYALDRSSAVPFGWRFDHDPSGSFAGMDFAPGAAGPRDFAATHVRLSTSPDSPFVRTVAVQRRDVSGVDTLRGRVLIRQEGSPASPGAPGSPDGGAVRREEELTSSASWYAALADVFGLTLDDVPVARRRALWERVCRAHEAWAQTRRVSA
jgi:N-hydroxyarylamine O-acetyltransferase